MKVTGFMLAQVADELCRSGAMDVILIDSVSALIPKSEMERDMGDPQVGSQVCCLALHRCTGQLLQSQLIRRSCCRQAVQCSPPPPPPPPLPLQQCSACARQRVCVEAGVAGRPMAAAIASKLV